MRPNICKDQITSALQRKRTSINSLNLILISALYIIFEQSNDFHLSTGH